MTAKTFFNKGIYISVLKRFWVGAVLYFLGLYVPVSVMSAEYFNIKTDLYSLLYSATIFSYIVPAVVAFLVYKYVHSKKQSIFVHSLPVTRKEVYVSSTLGALTLMAVPVLLNGIFIMLKAGSFSAGAIWAAYTLFVVFVLMGFAAFAAMLTGTGWIIFAIFGIYEGIFPFIGLCYEEIMDIFAFGYGGYNSPVSNLLISLNIMNFMGAIPNHIDSIIEGSATLETFSALTVSAAVFTVLAVVLYILAYLLYKKRNMEKCEDVAPYKILNPIFKYMMTIAVTVFVFIGFVGGLDGGVLYSGVMAFIFSAVAYFGTEMILRKKIKVWDSYKGFVVFTVIAAVFFSYMGFSDVFGYETYVPEKTEIEAVYLSGEHTYNARYVKNEVVIDQAIVLHKELMKTEGKVYNYSENEWPMNIYIRYKLNDGEIVSRCYRLPRSETVEIFKKLYENDEYKKAQYFVFSVDADDMREFRIRNPQKKLLIGKFTESDEAYLERKEKIQILECIKKDILANDYESLNNSGVICNIATEYNEDYDSGIIVMGNVRYEGYMDNYIYINENYTETIKWLKDNGYLEDGVKAEEPEDLQIRVSLNQLLTLASMAPEGSCAVVQDTGALTARIEFYTEE